ncbi:hypothetical protein GE061_004479 [Apolygus lucorum]|uniref:Uncharacterized protein n=1 Tax=Apolygus lucorum TaxID=248454 RepID=A0A8S9WZB0_APOLU|nr:hypothetical protein GE061_004479 [Apolygus lucorum]
MVRVKDIYQPKSINVTERVVKNRTTSCSRNKNNILLKIRFHIHFSNKLKVFSLRLSRKIQPGPEKFEITISSRVLKLEQHVDITKIPTLRRT